MATYSYLALGDSYTIGEQLDLMDSFPYQAVQLLRNAGFNFQAPEIIAASGWTTDELKDAIDRQVLLSTYDFVSLLIGVNNQFRGRSVEEFRTHFRTLLEHAISLADGVAENVIVISIPDYSVTPFANGRSPESIRSQIDTFNFICQAEAEHYQAQCIDITTSQRADGHKAEFLAPDLLHPSSREYSKWAEKVSNTMITVLEGARPWLE
jgi:lysophospholipase L1-like esterase